MNLKYFGGSLLAIPLLPIMYWQARKIRAAVPKLPEASGPAGVVNNNNKDEFKLITIGESTIAGIGVATHTEGFSGTLAKEIGSIIDYKVSWKVYAKSGYTARMVKNKLVPKITEKEADLIVIGLGGNDSFKLNSQLLFNNIDILGRLA